jgi:hypothetical protein
MIEEVTVRMVKDALKGISNAKDVKCDDDLVTFTYRDKDGDNVLAFISIEESEKVTCMMLMPIPDEYFVTSMICSNLYNSQKDTHGTFVYALSNKESKYIAIESHLLTRGGITEEALKFFLKNFIQHIDRYETIMIPAIQETGPDSSIIKCGAWDAFWSAVGAVLKGAAGSLDE